MKLLVVGVDHHSAPTSVREALAFEGARLAEGLARFSEAFPAIELAILSTCNRVEVYTAADDEQAAPSVADVSAFLAEFHGIPSDRFSAHLIDRHNEEVILHLFRVSASLESVVLGEGQILGQVREAYQAAERGNTIGSVLHAVFREAIRVGKKVRETTGINQGRLSVASVAVDVARDVFDTFKDKTVLVVGAGKMGDLTLRHLAELEPGRVLVTNRDPAKAEFAAARWSGQAVPFERLHSLLIDADVVISTTASAQPIVTLENYERVRRARRNRLTLILDIAVPRDFDARIGDLDQVLLYNVDDLQAQALANLKKRSKGIDPAQRIIEHEAAGCAAILRHRRTAGRVLRQLGDYADEIRLRELDKVFAGSPDLTEAQRESIEHFARRLQNQFLHHPRSALRSAAESAEPDHAHSLLSAVKHLFGLDREGRHDRVD